MATAKEARLPPFVRPGWRSEKKSKPMLSEREWQKIKSTSGLPEDVRGDIERTLALYKHLTSAKGAPAAKTKKRLRRLAELAAAMRRELAERDVQSALMPRAPAAPESEAEIVETAQLVASGAGMSKRRAFGRLPFPLLLRQLEELRNRCEAHAQGVEKRGAHKSAEINRWLVSELDAILYANIGRHISRSDKRPELDYVQLCFKVANPKIGSGSIEKAIRFYLGLARAAK